MLRETGLPLTTKDIALRVVTECGVNVADPRLTWTLHKRVVASLRHLRAKGQVKSSPGGGATCGGCWSRDPSARAPLLRRDVPLNGLLCRRCSS